MTFPQPRNQKISLNERQFEKNSGYIKPLADMHNNTLEMLPLLPIELQRLILGQLETPELKRLRRVSKSLNATVSPLLFSHLVIDVKTGAGIDAMSSLALGKSTIGPLFHSIEIRSLCRTSSSSLRRQLSVWVRNLFKEERMGESLTLALSQLVSVSSVSITVANMRALSPETANTIIATIACLPKLSHLTLDVHNCVGSSPLLHTISRQFHSLNSLHLTGGSSVRPEDLSALLMASRLTLTTLQIDGAESPQCSNFEIISNALHSMPCGVSLPLKTMTIGGASRLSNPSSPSIFRHLAQLDTLNIHCEVTDDFWNSLRTNGIHIRHLSTSTSTLSDAMLAYLQSYSGLISLTIDATVLMDCQQYSDQDQELLGAILYQCVLPKHGDSLESLQVVPPYAGALCLKSEYLPSLLSCPKLTTLTVGLEMTSKTMDTVPVTTALFDAISDGYFPSIRHIGLSVETQQSVYDPSDSGCGKLGSQVRGHHHLQDLLDRYRCSKPSAVLRALTVNSGHMGNNVLVQSGGDQWGFQLTLP